MRAARTLRAALRLLPPLAERASRDVDVVRVSCLLTLAVSELARGGLPAAEPHLAQARRLAGDDPELVARWRAQRGFILGRCGDFASAAGELAVVVDQPRWFTPLERCAMLLNRGMVFVELGRPAEAADAFREASALAGDGGDARQLFMARHNLGYALYLTGDLPAALSAMAAAEELPADVFRGPSLLDLGRVLGEAGLLDEAVSALDRARAACRPRQDQLLRAEIDLERARVLWLAGDVTEAAVAARASRERFRRLGAAALAARADLSVLDCALSAGRGLARVLAGALADEQVAVRLGDGELRARSITAAAEAAARLGRPDAARDALRRYPPESFGLVVHLRHAYAAAITEVSAGRAPRSRLAAAAADLAASQAVSASLDSRAARKVLGLRLAALDTDLAVRRGPTDVLATLERWSSHSLPVIRPPADPRQAELTERLRALSQSQREEPPGPAAAERRNEVARLRRELTGLGLAQRQADLADDPLPGLTDALASVAAAGRDLLRLFPHDGALWGVGVVGGRRRLSRLADLGRCLETSRRVQADLRVAASAPPGALAGAIAASLAGELGWLDDTIVRPWRLRSAGLVVVGSHAVASVPWGLLPSLRGVPVTVARSVAEWAGRRSERRGRAGVRVLTGPALRFADAEGARVADAWPGATVSLQASGDDLRTALAGADVVHVAAHGRHRPGSPMFSSLQLADGEVFAHELPAGRVNAGHVVLSACDVGTSEVRPGDEPLGLATTLLALGVRSVVAAVAPVRDEVTADVMAAYHAALQRGLPSDEALAATAAGSAFVVLGSTWGISPRDPSSW